ncbi:hypothetical protein ABIF38_008920 [Bradyrhizobium japonicum]|jgi:hypothetical protein|uniref:Uncharacterized protein n=1 Tax=Bradyrhizobium elkanii TaxID=29448 RepID=A0A4Y3ZNM8_BRAEL|nr:hypothetical protein [Bradyrhizobium elkanii]MCS4007407.1 hypothetical protein [Bradyrhizobium elkanii USDA 61]MCP1728763.1 hypothetical protein [Bradyrhizobium elkanii]MCP1755613.1 hypothetical protein [Bradyrhizobium elkanii]MCP1929268.1 hypothetical protein [Bradyrhizobium elkanii]
MQAEYEVSWKPSFWLAAVAKLRAGTSDDTILSMNQAQGRRRDM